MNANASQTHQTPHGGYGTNAPSASQITKRFPLRVWGNRPDKQGISSINLYITNRSNPSCSKLQVGRTKTVEAPTQRGQKGATICRAGTTQRAHVDQKMAQKWLK